MGSFILLTMLRHTTQALSRSLFHTSSRESRGSEDLMRRKVGKSLSPHSWSPSLASSCTLVCATTTKQTIFTRGHNKKLLLVVLSLVQKTPSLSLWTNKYCPL